MIDQAIGVAVLLAIGGLVYAVALCVLIAWRLRHPPRRTYASALARSQPTEPGELSPPLRFESWSFRSRGVELPAWDMKGRDSNGPTVIFTPGWGDSRIGALPRAAQLAPHASRLIAWDPPGLGEAPGTCSLGVGEVDDLLALIEHVGPRPIVLYGWSLGAGVSIAAASRPGAGSVIGVVAEAPYRYPVTPARNVLRGSSLPHGVSLDGAMWICGLGGRRRFDRVLDAEKVACPLLVIHGEHDAISPPADGRLVAQAARSGSFACVFGGDHNRLWTDPEMVEQARDAAGAFFVLIAN